MRFFTYSKLLCCVSPHLHSASLFNKSPIGFISSDKFGRYLPRYWIIPMMLLSFLWWFQWYYGFYLLFIWSDSFLWYDVSKEFDALFFHLALFMLNFNPASCSLLITWSNCLSCSAADFANTITSSGMLSHLLVLELCLPFLVEISQKCWKSQKEDVWSSICLYVSWKLWALNYFPPEVIASIHLLHLALKTWHC